MSNNENVPQSAPFPPARPLADNEFVYIGNLYTILPDPPMPLTRRAAKRVGHGGTKVPIRFHDGRTAVSCNVWNSGLAPGGMADTADVDCYGHPWYEPKFIKHREISAKSSEK